MPKTEASVVVVTGENGALGGAVASLTLAEGARVIALDRFKEGAPALERVSAALVRVRPLESAADALRLALAAGEAELGPVTGAVLTAGAWRGGKSFTDDSQGEDFDAVFSANLESAELSLRAILPGLVARQHGSVVLVGSRSGVRPYGAPGEAAYAASKAALIALAQSIAAEVLAAGVRVNVVLPSTIDSDANRRAMPGADPSKWVTPASLAGVISFLLSDAARDISGAALPVYGRVNV